MRLSNNYRCKVCGFDHEVWLDDEEDDVTEKIKDGCKRCGADLVLFNFKNNAQVWNNPDTP